MTKQKYILYFFTFFLTTLLVDAQNFCGTGTGDTGDTGDPGCNYNTFINSGDPNTIDPNTIEYDNIVSGNHATIAREANGGFIVWGQHAAPNGTGHQLTPTPITYENGYEYEGTPLKATLGSYFYGTTTALHQFALLTTEGLYIWGRKGALVHNNVKNTEEFGSVAIGTKGEVGTNPTGLPFGVEPEEVKMMFGSQGTLAIVTCSGEAWILSTMGRKEGDGTANNSDPHLWHRIKTGPDTPLENVVAMRGTPNAMMALTSDGEIYTWGDSTFLGDGLGSATREYATPMVIPAGKTPKMIGMTQKWHYGQTYYMLATDGNLYSLGGNFERQLGIWTDANYSYDWVQPTKPNAAGNASSGQVFNDVVWISPNEHDGYHYAAINVLTSDKKLYAWGVNTNYMIGGNGSFMGTPQATYKRHPMYMPGTSTNPDGLQVTDNVIAVETGGSHTIIIREGTENFGFVGHAYFGSMGDGDVNSKVKSRYTFSTAPLNVCGTQPSPMACYKPGNFTSAGLSTNIGITSLRNANTDGWPQVRKGAWIALESKTKGFVPNRLTTAQITNIGDPVEGMMVYNTDQDCLQIYVDAINGWKCFNVQSCD